MWEERRSSVNTAQYRRRRRRRARREENKQGSACGEMDEGCGEMREEPPEEPQAGGRSHCGYSCTCTCSARWGASLIHCIYFTCSDGREPKQCCCCWVLFFFSDFAWILQIQTLSLCPSGKAALCSYILVLSET